MSSFISGTFVDILSFAAEVIIIRQFFIRIPEAAEEGEGRGRVTAGYLALLILLIIYLTPLNAAAGVFSAGNLGIQILRMLLHLLPVFLYLVLAKDTTWKVAAYLAAFVTAAFLTAQNLRMVVMTYATDLPPQTAQGAGYIAGVIISTVTEALLAWITWRMIRPEEIDTIDRGRVLFMSVVLFIMVYFKWILTAVRELSLGGNRTAMVSFSLVTSLGLYLVLILYDFSRRMLREKESAEHDKLMLQYEVKNAKTELQASKDIRRIHHDVKNHLLAIKSMAGDENEVSEYLDGLLPQFEGYESQVHTGNSSVDAILSEKVRQAAREDIHFNVCMDLEKADFIRSVDLVTIFGNAADNAVEALKKVEGGEDRFVYMKSSIFANNLLLRFQNRYSGTVKMRNGLPVTSKKEKDMHGIGVSSIRNAAERYGGTVTVSADNDKHIFTLSVMIPLPAVGE